MDVPLQKEGNVLSSKIRNNFQGISMKLKKLYSFSDGNQVWRILLSGSEKFLFETRDTDKKQAYFHSHEIFTGKSIFKNFQPEEKYWIGIEAIHNDIIYFHKFTKPDMPGHKAIIAVDINSQKVLWQNESYAFMFIYDDKVYGFVEKFEGKSYAALDYKSGEIIEDMGNDQTEISRIKNLADEASDYSDYLFPEIFNGKFEIRSGVVSAIENEANNIEITGNIEYTIYEKMLLMNFHSKAKADKLQNIFVAVDLDTGEKIFSEILNSNVNAVAPDSFFVFKNILVLLQEKKNILIYKLVE